MYDKNLSWGEIKMFSEKNRIKLYHSVDFKDTPFDMGRTENGEIYCIKRLMVYNTDVFEYLKKKRNKHIPKIYSYEEKNGELEIHEEWIIGQTLTEYISDENPDRNELIRIVDDVCDALIFLHKAKPPIIHRDVKPDNIMIEPDGRVLLIDYDAARVYKTGERTDTEFIGTEGYAAPEQYGFGQSDARTDMYALGKMIMNIFSENDSMQIVAEAATRMDPEDRYRSMHELQHMVKKAGKVGILDTGDESLLDMIYGEAYCDCPNCGAILNDQEGFDPDNGVWTCTKCGMRLYGDAAGDTGEYNTGIIWYCDNCGTVMNKQPGFDYYADTWICTECGTLNDISVNNIDPDLTK